MAKLFVSDDFTSIHVSWGMMESRLWVQDLLGVRDLKGKSFYLDGVKNRHSTLLVEAISRLGGKVEGFLNKDVSFVVSGSQAAWHEGQAREVQRRAGGAKVATASSPVLTHHRGSQGGSRQHTATPRPEVCGSRGKALLEKAIRNNERCHESSVLANARSWGVKIVHVDDFLSCIDRLTVESAKAKGRKVEKKAAESSVPRVVKAAALKSPYLKIEDCSRKYRPLYLQSMSLPTLDYTGRFSPFELPAPPPPKKEKDQGNCVANVRRQDPSTSQEKPTPLPLIPSPSRPRKKTVGYCECCQLAFKDQDEHLKSDQHRGFVQVSSHYSVVDQLVALMEPGFVESPINNDPATMRLLTPLALPLDPSLELDPQVHSDTDKAIQVLLTQGSPPQVLSHLAEVTSMEQEVEESGTQPLGTKVLPISLEEAEVDPVPMTALTVPTAAPGPLPPGQQHCCPEGKTVSEPDGGGIVWPQEELPVESSWPTPVSPQCHEPAEEDKVKSSTFKLTCPSAAQNPRKRSRSFSFSPRSCDPCVPQASQDSSTTLSQSYSSICIEASLLPDPSAYSPSSESDWDCGLLSQIVPAVPPPARGEQCLVDLELLQRPCAGMQDSSYESRLCSVLHPPTPPPSLCGEDTDPALSTRNLDSCLEACVSLGLKVHY
ncbi:hypothetical protein MATL_G00012770 [Megalops atlanticus]|uniref:DBF4-type domain-containing protein n=1 Tax=Megalops atlanticus TaxID=7932 RepID=A0A9D3QHF0_MEGAT|nr:hypothetical protein MATL_G00012770 [Megalops atlanticus]